MYLQKENKLHLRLPVRRAEMVGGMDFKLRERGLDDKVNGKDHQLSFFYGDFPY